jgi:hypothetical protein
MNLKLRLDIWYLGEYLYDIVRLPKDFLDEISWIPLHPDEIFNTTMFTVISIEKTLMEWKRR